jgi:hypothetical protein
LRPDLGDRNSFPQATRILVTQWCDKYSCRYGFWCERVLA